MKVEGKPLASGTYRLERLMYKVIGEKPQPSYILVIHSDKITLSEDEIDITAQIRHLEFKKKGIIFLWRNPSRIGLPFSAILQ